MLEVGTTLGQSTAGHGTVLHDLENLFLTENVHVKLLMLWWKIGTMLEIPGPVLDNPKLISD